MFESHVAKANLPSQTVAAVRKRCIDLTVRLSKEIQNRLPSNYMTLQKMTQLSVDNTLKQLKDNSIAELAVELGFEEEKIENILKQWHSIHFVKWDIMTADTVQFRAHVLKYKDAAGSILTKTADLAITVLSLPHSNAEVERMFSQMNIIKNKLRNRLASTTLNSILLIRNQLKILKQNCHS